MVAVLIVVVVGVLNKCNGKRTFLCGLSVCISWTLCSVVVLCDLVDDGVVHNVGFDLVKHVNHCHKLVVVGLEGHVPTLTEPVE